MRKISKSSEPKKLLDWKRRHSHGSYRDIANTDISFAIREACIQEQHGLCAFCCVSISADSASSHNAHLQSQHHFPQKSLLWDNIVASCNTENSCGKHQKDQDIPLTPLMQECEKELKFYLSGKVIGLTQRAQDTIEILNLNSLALQQRRKKSINDFLFSKNYSSLDEDSLKLDKKTWQAIIEDCCIPDEHGRLLSFTPALVNIGWNLLNEQEKV